MLVWSFFCAPWAVLPAMSAGEQKAQILQLPWKFILSPGDQTVLLAWLDSSAIDHNIFTIGGVLKIVRNSLNSAQLVKFSPTEIRTVSQAGAILNSSAVGGYKMCSS